MRTDPKALTTALLLSRLPGVGARRFRSLIERFGDPESALAHQESLLAGRQLLLPGFSQRKSATEEGIDRARAYLAQGGQATFWGHPGYPHRLSTLSEPPPVLFFSGTFPNGPLVAVVGTRHPAPRAVEVTLQLTRALVDAGFATISGGAQGIDTICHQATIDNHGKTIAVFGCGIDVFYPRSNASLFSNISRTGALVSELLPGTPPRRDFFPTRNRIVAGWADAVVVVQAGEKSGASITARMANKFRRPLLVLVPAANEDHTWEGNRLLLAAGACPFSRPDEVPGLARRLMTPNIPATGTEHENPSDEGETR
jgi:DNA processing protein